MRTLIFAVLVVVVCSMAALAGAAYGWNHSSEHQDFKQVKREVAVLLCSHHWTETDAGVVVNHERPSEVEWCMRTYDRTGRVP